MSFYLFAGVAAAVISATLTGLLYRWAVNRGYFIAEIRQRDLHRRPTPRVGGIAIVGAFLAVSLLLYALYPDRLSFSSDKILGIDANFLGLVIAVIVLSVANIADDFKAIPWQTRLGVEILAAIIILLFGITVPWLSNPLGGKIILGAAGYFLVIFWLVGISNAINWLDGVNGLAGGVSAIAVAILFYLSISPQVNQPSNALLSAVALGAIVGFLPYNIFQAKAFLGDTGSVFLGFLIGILAIISGGKLATAFLVLSVPFLDAIVVLISRLANHQSPFIADRRHLHHRLLEFGLKPWQIVAIFYAITLLFGLLALRTQTLGKIQVAAGALVLMVLLVFLYSLKRRGAHL